MKQKAFAAMGAMLSAAGIAVGSAAPALAEPLQPDHFLEHQHFYVSESVIEQEVFPEFCAGVVDFPVLHTWNEKGMIKIALRDGLPYFLTTSRRTDTYTNTLNEKSITITTALTFKDQRIIDNGDGTFTILFKASGVHKSYGPDGTQLFMDTGVSKAEFLFDHGGTPADPSDDTFLSEKIIARHGHADTLGRDFCADLVTFIG